jgi:CRP/FNR family nitrogen fixation transcriptional regulator
MPTADIHGAIEATPEALQIRNAESIGHPGTDGLLRRNARRMSFVRDQEIYGEGNDATYIYRVEAGVVRTCKFLRDGRRQIHAFYRVGSVFGLQAGTKYCTRAAAVCDCIVAAYRRLNLETMAAAGDRLSLQLFVLALDGLEQAQEHALLLGRRSAAEKVASFLLAYAKDAPSGGFIKLPMTRLDIADYLGLTIETVSRMFSHLEEGAFIELSGAHLVRMRDVAALQVLCA